MTHKLLVLFAAGLLAGPIAVQAAPTPDQVNEAPVTGMAALGAEYRAQTFTVGRTGTLSRIEVQLFGVGATGSAVFEIWNTTNGAPVAIPGRALATATIAFSGVNSTFVGADLTPGIPVKSGDVLAIVYVGRTTVVAPNFAYWHQSTLTDPTNPTNPTMDPYPLGARFTTTVSAPTGPWLSFGAFPGPSDFNFRTYVDAYVDPATRLQTLRSAVTGFGPYRLLEQTISQAQAYYAVPDIISTCSFLRFFDYQVRGIWQLSNATPRPALWKITTAQKDDWLGQSTGIQLAINCPSH